MNFVSVLLLITCILVVFAGEDVLLSDVTEIAEDACCCCWGFPHLYCVWLAFSWDAVVEPDAVEAEMGILAAHLWPNSGIVEDLGSELGVVEAVA